MRALIRHLYDLVHVGLWAFGAAVLLWIIFHGPALSEWRAQLEAQRALELAEENRAYCEKWGMPASTHAHTLCTLDLNALRAHLERHMTEELDGFM